MTRTAQITFGEMKQLQVTVLQGIPDDLEPERVRGHIGSGKARLHEALRLVLQSDLTQVDSTQLAALLSGRVKFPEKYVGEEVKPAYFDPVRTGQLMKSPAEKLAVLARHWPTFDGSHVQRLAEDILNEGALGEGEETLVMPKPSLLGSTYNDALSAMLSVLGQTRAFRNWREGQLGTSNMRLTEKTAAALKKLEEETPGDYLVFPAQFGTRHAGRSVRRARACFDEQEFGLGPYEVAAYLLTTPERFTRWEDLVIDCAGVEYKLSTVEGFGFCLYFDFNYGLLRFAYSWSVNAIDFSGSASGFLR